jgi:Co/Zn/Cd efflux system component
VFVTLCAVSIFDGYAFVVIVTRGQRLRFTNFSGSEKNFVRVIAIIGLVANWVYLLARPHGVF